ncbi:MAG: AMP-binding protein [Myxacorys chilensis ATA2-1-KO14]|jgi:long-chain acyl-CoA synthetase|nr:AMP-binding protein [Myxacorys chilensis ATA2-1-KO14]
MFSAKNINQLEQRIRSPLGHTLPSLLDEACRLRPNAAAFNQSIEAGWRSLSNSAFQAKTEALALGLLDLGLERGDRVALLIRSDVNFAIADMSCLLAGLVDVPIDLTQTLENIVFVLQHSEAKAFIVANLEVLQQVLPYLDQAPNLEHIILVEAPANPVTHLHKIYSLDHIRAAGQAQHSASQVDDLRTALSPHDLATLVYVPGTDGQLLGVMLTHENLSGNALAAFASLSRLQWGMQEIALSFLPLTHVFARCLIYGHIYYGHTIYFSNPNRVLKHLKEVKPTIFASVPLLLEKIYSKTLEQSSNLPSKRSRLAFALALWLAKRYKLGYSTWGIYALLLKIADRFVWSPWRSLFGNRLKYLLCGGAALKPELANVFAAAGVEIFQGYGLTQASAVVCCNRDRANRAGTVGRLIEGVEVAIAPDHEILVRGAYVTPGYYKKPAATEAAIDERGWLHTGDLGALTKDGFLQVTGLKKALFKLSTGKYIAPQPIEARLENSPLVKQAIVVGADQKFCGALIVPDFEALRKLKLGLPEETLLKHPCVLSLYQAIVDEANCHQPYWASVKRCRLLSSNESINRQEIASVLAKDISLLYTGDRTTPQDSSGFDLQEIECPVIPTKACPTFAQSLNLSILN